MGQPDDGLLLLDVDGPLNPYAAQASRRPPGYETFRQTTGGRWLTGKEARKRKGLRVWLNPAHGPMLRELAEETGLTLVWATTWQHEANTCVAPAIGLPELPVIEFTPSTGWKWAAVAAYAQGRPIAWLDDQFDEFPAARGTFDEQRAGASTFLCHVDPATGLLDAHVDAIRHWHAAE
nr:HAD domain-containing protein [Kibdelosporangium sp. MJ126-NF4]CEL21842.1 putative secreted protein [Kibdelosporangium sp. MJ126-NF4]CTQ92621.1 putative secreted protein [Kibdelosporangium sp. MJ126-NF4]